MATALPRSVVGICVGVDKPGLLHDLKAAGTGAKKFHEWLLSQRELGVQVTSTLFTEDEGPVTRRRILDAISAVVKDRACDALFIYLAGHGVAHSAYEEKLLLSDVTNDDAEAINLQIAKQRGKYCGIPHVVIIYDACRSFATTDKLKAVSGGPIFPAGSISKTGGHVDVFYACAPDESSFEIADTSGAHPDNYRAFFTEVLLDALHKPDVTLVEQAKLGGAAVEVIPCARLETMLERQIPRLAADSNPSFEQAPDIDVLSHMPGEFFAVVPPPGRAEAAEVTFGGVTGAATGTAVGHPPFRRGRRGKKSVRKESGAPKKPKATTAEIVKWHAGQAFRQGRAPSRPLPPAMRSIERLSGFQRVASDARKTQGRRGFETHCGFTVIGAPVQSFEVSNNACYGFVAEASTARDRHYRVGGQPWDARGGTALIQFSDGSGVALAVLPGYVGTVLVEEGQVRAITYAVAEGAREYGNYMQRQQELDERRAIATAAASIGKLQELSRQVGDGLTEYIRVDKALDPCLGVLAAYSCYLSDNPAQVKSIWDRMSRVEVAPYAARARVLMPVPFDVSMLAGQLEPATAWKPPGVAPFCPWLSFGWSLLDLFDVSLHPAIVEAGRHRQPGTWTSFTKRGIDVLREAMKSKEIQ
jgi:hypothetical protein